MYLVGSKPIDLPVTKSLNTLTTAPVGGSPSTLPSPVTSQPFSTLVSTSSLSPLTDSPPDTVRVAAVSSFPI